MRNRIRIRAVATASVIFGALTATVPAAAQGEPDVMYERDYYSDASYTVQVGYERDTCNRYGIGSTRTYGVESPYVQYVPIARCVNGQLEPY